MKELTIIVPLLEGYDRTDLLKTLKSVKEQTVQPSLLILAMSKKIDEEQNYSLSVKEIVEDGKIEISKAINDSENTQELVNYAVSTSDTKYFMVVESGEILGKTWLETVERYISKGYDYQAFLPLAKVNDDNGVFLTYLNEMWHALGFSESQDLGVIDEEGLKNIFEVCVTGAVIDRESFESIGGLKTNIKYFYWYEYLLRHCYNKKIAYVVPKALYTIKRKDLTGVSREEYQLFYEKAREEYFFNKQRDIE